MAQRTMMFDGAATNMSVVVSDDEVWVGFFAADGKSGVVSVGQLAAVAPGSVSRAAIESWASDLRKKAGCGMQPGVAV